MATASSGVTQASVMAEAVGWRVVGSGTEWSGKETGEVSARDASDATGKSAGGVEGN